MAGKPMPRNYFEQEKCWKCNSYSCCCYKPVVKQDWVRLSNPIMKGSISITKRGRATSVKSAAGEQIVKAGPNYVDRIRAAAKEVFSKLIAETSKA